QCLQYFGMIDVPNANNAVRTTGNEALTVGVECHSTNPAVVAGQYRRLLARVRVPHSDTPIETARRRSSAIATVRKTDDSAMMTEQFVEQLLGCQIADFDASIFQCRGEGMAVWMKGKRVDRGAAIWQLRGRAV